MLHSTHTMPMPAWPAPPAGNALFGFAVTPAVAHIVGISRAVTLRLVSAAGETRQALALMPHMVGPNTLRLHVERAVIDDAANAFGTDEDTVMTCRVDGEVSLRLSGRLHREHRSAKAGAADFVSMRLTMTSWTIAGSRAHDRRLA